ncbi:MAG TPA: DUF2934 domain-containing protein [Verrucomicrobiae bacterium]
MEAKPDAKDEPKPQAKAEVEAKPAVEPNPEAKAKTTADFTPQIAAKAYELYEREGHRDGQSALNWDKAEQEIRATQAKAEPKAEAKPAANAGAAPEAKAQPNPDGDSKPAAKVEPKPDTKTDIKPTDKVEPKPDAQTETKPVTNGKPGAEVSPQLVKKVHEFYEQLGREDVRAVEESDQADHDNRTDETKTDAKAEDKAKT